MVRRLLEQKFALLSESQLTSRSVDCKLLIIQFKIDLGTVSHPSSDSPDDFQTPTDFCKKPEFHKTDPSWVAIDPHMPSLRYDTTHRRQLKIQPQKDIE